MVVQRSIVLLPFLYWLFFPRISFIFFFLEFCEALQYSWQLWVLVHHNPPVSLLYWLFSPSKLFCSGLGLLRTWPWSSLHFFVLLCFTPMSWSFQMFCFEQLGSAQLSLAARICWATLLSTQLNCSAVFYWVELFWHVLPLRK